MLPPSPRETDIELLIVKLGDLKQFKEKATADRSRLPKKQMDYPFKHQKLLELINYGIENNISDKRWADIL